MSASSLGLELIMRELVMGDIRGSGDTSARAHKALIIAVVTRGIYISASRMMPSLLMVERGHHGQHQEDEADDVAQEVILIVIDFRKEEVV